MKIVIAGAGEVGSHLAKLLSKENQDIIVIDSDERKLMNLDNYNLLTHTGSPTSFATLRDAQVGRADLYIAVTPFETRNVTSCAMAKSLGAKKTVARIDNYEFLRDENRPFFETHGVDFLIYPEYLAAEEIITGLERTWVRNWFELCEGQLIVVGVKLRESSALVGKKLKELYSLSSKLHISAIKHKYETVIPGGTDEICSGDIAYIATTAQYVDELRTICGKAENTVKRVMIMGGSRIAIQLARLVGDRYKIKIIESDLEKCHKLAEKLPDCNIVHGDARDIDLLHDEGIEDHNAFIALTDSSETNILACLTAKEYGMKKTIAEVENIQFIAEAESLNIGKVINKKLLASSHIFQILLDSDQSNAKCLALADAEVAELVAKEGSRITRADVKDLSLSHDMTIAGLVRDGVGHLVQGNTRIKAGDHVVVFCLSGAIHKIEKLFN